MNNNISKQTLRLTIWCAYISGVLSAFGILFILVFYGLLIGTGKGYGVGEMNDIAVTLQYIFMLPLFFVFHRILRTSNQRTSLMAISIGLFGALSVILLQILLLAGIIPFSKQIGIVVIAFLITLIWFIMNKKLDRAGILIPGGMFLNVMAGLVFGYPIWSFKLAKKLKDSQLWLDADSTPKQSQDST